MDVPDVLTIGRVSVDLYTEQIGVPLRDATTLRKSIGGTSTNVAVAAARLGVHAATVTKVGADPMGDYVRDALANTFGVDVRWVGVDDHLPTPLAFAVLDPASDPHVFFYREPSAPDQHLTLDDVDLDVVGAVPVLWIPASCVAWEPSRSTVHAVLDARGRRAHTVLDLDWRPMFWTSAHEAATHIAPLLDHVTIAIGNRAECEIAVGTTDPDEAADRLLARGLDAALVKLGPDGVLVALADGTRERIPPFEIDLVCGLGSGDAFGGALCHALVTGIGIVDGARRGNAAGAIVAGRMMCADDMPTPHDIDALLAAQVAGGPLT
jgi:5-dehydro-2-deoxygluconokinase